MIQKPNWVIQSLNLKTISIRGNIISSGKIIRFGGYFSIQVRPLTSLRMKFSYFWKETGFPSLFSYHYLWIINLVFSPGFVWLLGSKFLLQTLQRNFMTTPSEDHFELKSSVIMCNIPFILSKHWTN